MPDPIPVSARAIAMMREFIRQRQPTPPEIAYRRALADALDVPKGWRLDLKAAAFVPPASNGNEA